MHCKLQKEPELLTRCAVSARLCVLMYFLSDFDTQRIILPWESWSVARSYRCLDTRTYTACSPHRIRGPERFTYTTAMAEASRENQTNIRAARPAANSRNEDYYQHEESTKILSQVKEKLFAPICNCKFAQPTVGRYASLRCRLCSSFCLRKCAVAHEIDSKQQATPSAF